MAQAYATHYYTALQTAPCLYRCCLDINMHHEAIQYFRKILKLHEDNSDATVVPRARVYDELAEAYLADGR